ncbi:MAG: hypothetical protein ABSF16_14800, partial [Terracidiphilus sp.]
ASQSKLDSFLVICDPLLALQRSRDNKRRASGTCDGASRADVVRAVSQSARGRPAARRRAGQEIVGAGHERQRPSNNGSTC